MKVWVEASNWGTYELFNENGQAYFFQSDWDFPGLASLFGKRPCDDLICGTDGTVDCKHKTASQMIREAADFLDTEPSDDLVDVPYFYE